MSKPCTTTVLHTVRFVTPAPSRERHVTKRLADYVRQHALNQLWARGRTQPSQATGRRAAAAIELYFALVGERREEEWLVIEEFGKESLDD